MKRGAARSRRALLATLCAACAASAPHPQEAPPAADRLVSTRDMRGDFSLRQHLEFESAGERGSLEVVVQLHCGELIVMGLTAFGAPAFTIRQQGRGVRVESSLPSGLPFAPIYVLEDVHRVYFIPFARAASAEGTGEASHGSQHVSDVWQDGRVVERRFRELSGEPPGAVIVRYPGGATPGAIPAQVELTSEQQGHALEITTLSRTELRCERSPQSG